MSESDLTFIAETALNLDGLLCNIAHKACQRKDMVTEGISILMFVTDELLKVQALAYYMMDNDFYSLLLETEDFKLNFQKFNDIRPRTFIGEALFK